MIKIKLSAAQRDCANFLLQAPLCDKGHCAWGECHFYTHLHPAYDTQEYDHWIVYECLPHDAQTTICAHTWLYTGEPPSIKTYKREYLEQFGNIVTSHKLPEAQCNVINHQQALPWMYGTVRKDDISGHSCINNIENYDTLASSDMPAKNKLISVIASSKRKCAGHKDRLLYVEELKKILAKNDIDIDIFGWGIKNIACKKDAIAPYRYHIALENSAIDDYWTEKLSDCYLGCAFPIYYGCSNIGKYFPQGAYYQIDVSNPTQAAQRTLDFIKSHDIKASESAISKAKDAVLNEHNFIALASRLCCELKEKNKRQVTLKSQGEFDPLIKRLFRKFK